MQGAAYACHQGARGCWRQSGGDGDGRRRGREDGSSVAGVAMQSVAACFAACVVRQPIGWRCRAEGAGPWRWWWFEKQTLPLHAQTPTPTATMPTHLACPTPLPLPTCSAASTLRLVATRRSRACTVSFSGSASGSVEFKETQGRLTGLACKLVYVSTDSYSRPCACRNTLHYRA